MGAASQCVPPVRGNGSFPRAERPKKGCRWSGRQAPGTPAAGGNPFFGIRQEKKSDSHQSSLGTASALVCADGNGCTPVCRSSEKKRPASQRLGRVGGLFVRMMMGMSSVCWHCMKKQLAASPVWGDLDFLFCADDKMTTPFVCTAKPSRRSVAGPPPLSPRGREWSSRRGTD